MWPSALGRNAKELVLHCINGVNSSPVEKEQTICLWIVPFWLSLRYFLKFICLGHNKLEAQWAEPVSLTFHSALGKLYTEPSMVFPTKFRFIWPRTFREEYFLEIDQSETRITCGGHVC